MKTKDLVPFKAVVAELGVSRHTLWRAARSNIAGFPPPVVIRRLVFWRRADLNRLEDALLLYQGRCAFERARAANSKVTKLKQTKARQSKPARKRRVRRAMSQMDLFSRGGA